MAASDAIVAFIFLFRFLCISSPPPLPFAIGCIRGLRKSGRIGRSGHARHDVEPQMVSRRFILLRDGR